MNVSRRSLLAGTGAVALAAGLPQAAAAAAPRRRAGVDRPARSKFVRKDVSGLFDASTGAWAPELYWYAKAVGWMKEREQTDPNSWKYQWYTHGKPQRAQDDPPEWGQCSHGDRYFLPWHRWYVYYFERIVRNVIVTKLHRDDMADWALPYWNYAHLVPGGSPADSEEWRRVPLPFRQRRIHDPQGRQEEDNPLYLPLNMEGRCLGDESMSFDEVDPTAAMREPLFWPPEGGEVGSAGFSQVLERFPHGLVHNVTGGLMGSVPSAAADPVFWLHHANIDRFWAAWLTRHQVPTDWRWPKVRPKQTPDDPDLPFVLRDEHGGQHTLEGPVFTFPQNAYTYESLVDGMGTDAAPAAFLVTRVPSEVATAEYTVTDEVTRLGVEPLTLTISGERGAADTIATAVESDGQVVLTFEGVRADAAPCATFRVFLGDDESDTDPDGPAFVGHLTFFDNVGSHTAHAGGAEFSFDVTETLRRLPDQAWSGDEMPVVRVVPGASAEAEATAEAAPRFTKASFTVV
ncbi:tyrosinase family protein [Nocardiopsis halotolerans]|uniref:tyrosinase family protein n=1 Tax=Nocardiopsis halotolerans TaxID=124252 RepID=UPI000594BFDB|nr:tyrosinase family protein [Nocardiopsis halotolerans]